jgi:hypothetical protein
MRPYATTVTDLGIAGDVGIRTNGNTLPQFGAGLDNSGGMNLHGPNQTSGSERIIAIPSPARDLVFALRQNLTFGLG